MEMYSQDDGFIFGWSQLKENEVLEQDFKQNGKFCMSGLAYPKSKTEAYCTKFTKMMHND
jgi:hypothetical protein